MKWCPKCQSVVDAHCECPVCRTDLTDVECVDVRYEIYRYNKYFFLHLFRKHIFQMACLVIVLVNTVINIINGSFHWACLVAIFLAMLSLVESLYKNRMIQFSEIWNSSDVAEISNRVNRYASGILGVIVSFLIKYI